jgi:hypothetical protein
MYITPYVPLVMVFPPSKPILAYLICLYVSFNNLNTATLLNYLSYENWRDVFTEKNTNSMFNNFLNIFLRGFNYSFPIYSKHINLRSQNKWITKGILVSCKKKELYILNKYT